MCDKKFSSKDHIKKHYTTFHPKKPFSFNIHLPFASKQGKCGKSGSPLKVGEFGCIVCDKKFSSNDLIKKHYTSFHPKEPFSFKKAFASKQGEARRKSGSPLKVGEFGCVVCDKKFSSKYLINKHYISFHSKEPFSFKKPFASKQQPGQKGAQQKARQLKKACRKFGSPLKDGEFGCVVCDKKFSSKDYVKDHYTVFHPKEPFSFKKPSGIDHIRSKDFVVKYKTNYCEVNNQGVIFQSIKVEPPTIKQSQTSGTADPLVIDEIKEEIYEENEVTPIQDLSEVSIKQGEFGASEYQNEQESEMFDLEIKEELINPFVEYEKTIEPKMNNEVQGNEKNSRKQSLNPDSLRKDFP